MKMNKKQTMKVVVILHLLGLMGIFTQCMPQGSQVGGSDSSTYTPAPPPPASVPKTAGEMVYLTQVKNGVKNHEQILYTMGELTGIDPIATNAIMNVYRQVEPSLPTGNDIKIFSPTQQLAIMKLASEFCSTLRGNATLRAQVWPGLMYTSNPSVALTPANRAAFIDSTINAFWGGMAAPQEAAATHAEMNQLIDVILASRNTAAATGEAVMGVCTAMLSSAQVTLL